MKDKNIEQVRADFVRSVDELIALRKAHDADLAALRAENERLREALALFFVDYECGDKCVAFLPRAEFEKARAVLGAQKENQQVYQ